jgi:hypothetical protein
LPPSRTSLTALALNSGVKRKLEEAQVLVGNRVWLPFVCAGRYMRSCQSLLDSSLTQLYRVAERHRA